MRVHEIAKESHCTSKEVRTYLAETFGVVVKSASSKVGPPIFVETLIETLAAEMGGGSRGVFKRK